MPFFFFNGSLNLLQWGISWAGELPKVEQGEGNPKGDDLMQHDVMLGVFYDKRWLC